MSLVKEIIKDLLPEKEKIRSRAKKEETNKQIQDLLNSNHLQNIIKSSVSKDEAQTQISNFLK